MATQIRELGQATLGMVGATPPALRRKLGIKVLNVRGATGSPRRRKR